ncbi:MAG: hypothetical protein AMJ56_17590 [Anaerolineae bacterium SG8_19]|nr:MAG: hypothetical protein AMJ56_17590 [Anaerolineae bacterium SG8_19]
MSLSKLIAKQLSNPSPIIGPLIAGPLWNRRNSMLNDVAFEALALTPHDHVLEVGFGGGYLLGRISTVVTDGFLAGVDLSPAMVAFCEKRYRSLVRDNKLEINCAGAEHLPYPPGHFTKVCSVNSIFYWQDVPQALSEFWRVLIPGGKLVMCFTCKQSLERRKFASHGLALYETDEVERLIELAGFHDIQTALFTDRHREFQCMSGRK